MILTKEGSISLQCFLCGVALLATKIVRLFNSSFESYNIEVLVIIIYIIVINIFVFTKYDKFYDVAVRALGLGLVFSLGLILSFSENSFKLFGWYLTALSFFHWSEYFTTAYTNPKNLSIQSYLLDHSLEYHIAAFGSFIEFLIEWYFVTSWKQPNVISIVGLILVIGGEWLRKLAMYKAATNFNHYVQYAKNEEHELVTNGIYGYFRHPAYVGWFYWSLGTQIMMCNPVCLVGYAYAAWTFFNTRIYDEELALLHFFNEKYIAYQKKVPTGLPFISGFKVD